MGEPLYDADGASHSRLNSLRGDVLRTVAVVHADLLLFKLDVDTLHEVSLARLCQNLDEL